jgi:hypothetical protein
MLSSNDDTVSDARRNGTTSYLAQNDADMFVVIGRNTQAILSRAHSTSTDECAYNF